MKNEQTLKELIDRVKPSTADHNNFLKDLVSLYTLKRDKALESLKNGFWISNEQATEIIKTLEFVRTGLVLNVAILQRAANNAIEPTYDERLKKLITQNRDLILRNHWLEKRMELKTKYYEKKAEELPDLTRYERNK